MWWQRNIDQYWTEIANQKLYEFLYIAAAFIVPEVLAILLFIVPWVRNFVETSTWKVFHLMTWWFQVSNYSSPVDRVNTNPTFSVHAPLSA